MEVCRYYLKGNCAFGTACRLQHTRPNERGAVEGRAGATSPEEQQLELEEERIDPYDDEPCTYRQLREKYFGIYSEVDMRKYWQTEMRPTGNSRPALRPTTASVSRSSREVCKYFLKGACNFGESCRNLHVTDVAQLDGDLAISVSSRGGATEESRRGASSTQRATGSSSQPCRPQHPPPPPPPAFSSRGNAAAEDAECGICFESITEKGERFGMLESCACAFCLSCIRAWRKQKEQQDRVNLRMCPLCRNESFFVIPCEDLIVDPQEKSSAIEKYKHQMSLVPCQAFDYGRGKCPFGSSCFYAHLNPDGSRYNPAPVRKMVGTDGTQVIGEVKLSDFF